MPRFEGSNQSLPPPCGQNDAVSLYCSSSLAARLAVCGKRVVMGVARALKLRTNPRRFKRRLCGSVHMHVLAALQEMESDRASKRL